MLHLVWYIIVGFIAGCVAKALMGIYLKIMWTIVLGLVGSIIGGAVTHLFSPPSGGSRFSSCGINRLHTWSYCGFVCLAQI